MPASLVGRPLGISYNSPMAASQKASEAQAISQAIIQMAPLINADPTVLLNVDGDETFRSAWINAGADPKLLRSPQHVAQLRQALQQQQQLAEQAAIAKDFASAGRDASEAQTGLSRIGQVA